MNCSACFGTGVRETAYQHEPCQECGGYGVQHCCDGLREQPEKLFGPDGIFSLPQINGVPVKTVKHEIT